jgi:hypothetical protein
VNDRPAPARVKSLVGTARRLKKKNQSKLVLGRPANRLPCRPSGMWACIGEPERARRLASPAR